MVYSLPSAVFTKFVKLWVVRNVFPLTFTVLSSSKFGQLAERFRNMEESAIINMNKPS